MKDDPRPAEILEKVPVKLNSEKISKSLRIRSGEDRSRIESLLEKAKSLIHARAVYKTAYIEMKLEKAVVIDGVRLTSRILRKNLDQVWRIFPYVVTIGDELAEMSGKVDDLLERFWLDFIGNVALSSAQEYLRDLLRSRYDIQSMSCMNPGSLPDWPIEQQRALFTILGDSGSAIGVRLLASLVMQPTKSLSGIFFPTEKTFYNCQLCPRENCIGRRAQYSDELARRYED